jgi:hypothetical protein
MPTKDPKRRAAVQKRYRDNPEIRERRKIARREYTKRRPHAFNPACFCAECEAWRTEAWRGAYQGQGRIE